MERCKFNANILIYANNIMWRYYFYYVKKNPQKTFIVQNDVQLVFLVLFNRNKGFLNSDFILQTNYNAIKKK